MTSTITTAHRTFSPPFLTSTPISDETTQFFDGILTSFGVEGDKHVNELLSIETPGLWEALDVPPINQEQDNLPGAPASDAEAIDHILGIV